MFSVLYADNLKALDSRSSQKLIGIQTCRVIDLKVVESGFATDEHNSVALNNGKSHHHRRSR